MVDLIYKNEVYIIVGAAMEVHQVLGRGFLEAVYLNYLKATGFEAGVLINFGSEHLQWKRMVHTKKINNPIRDHSSELA